MSKSIYNLDQLVKVEVQEKEQSARFYYRPAESHLFGLIKSKEGFRPISVVASNELYTKEEIEAGKYEYGNRAYIVEDYKVYCKPRVVLHFNNSYILNIDCDTNEEAYTRMLDIKSMSIPNSLETNQ